MIKDTAFASATAVTGIDFRLYFEDHASGGVTVRYELGYALGGVFTSWGFVDEGPHEPQLLYVTDLSSINGIAPTGSHLALKIIDVAPSAGNLRMSFGSNESSGVLNVSETLAREVSGTVFEDSDFAGTASDYDGGVNDLALADVDVELYDNTDTYLGSTTTDGSGNFSFAVIDGTYKVRARTATIGDSNTPPAGTFNAACGITDPASGTGCVVADQTWGNGVAAYGGQSATADDTATNNDAGPGDTWANVTVSGADVPNNNFGFAYNLIVNTSNSGQGSLRQFIDNANDIGSAGGTTANSSEFRVPATDPGFVAGVAEYTPATAYPILNDPGTTIDGETQTSNNGNTNPVILGTGGTVGVDAVSLSTVAGPEIEIRDGAGLAHGLRIQANSASIRGIAILGFGSADEEAAIRIDSGFTGALIERNVIGSTATSFTDPGAALRNYSGVAADGADSGTVQDNLIGFGHRGVYLVNGSDGWTVDGNEIVEHDLGSTDGDGMAIDTGTNNTISGNLIAGSSSQALVLTNSTTINFVNNTVTGNGVGTTTAFSQTGAITLRPTASGTTIDRNIIQANYGAGVQVNDGATNTILTRNSFADNGAVAARSTPTLTGQIGIDLNVSGDNNNLGTPDFFSVNSQLDTLPDFPILDTATISGGNLTLTGWSKPGATIEVFIAAPDSHGFGEGETYIGTFVEGVSDGDSGTSDYSGLINGIDQGDDVNASRFGFTVPIASLAAPVVTSDQLTGTATLSGETSEFSGLVTVALPQADLTLTISDTPDPAPLAGPLLYTLLITNNGPSTATGVTVTDTLPASVTLVSATPNQGSCSGVAVVTCNLGAIINSGTASIEILVTTSAVGSITNNASVTANEPDPVPGDNADSEDTDVVVGGTNDIPLTQYTRLHGFLDHVVTGGSLRTGDTGGTRCDIAASSAETLAGIPGTATVRAAYLYWSASGVAVDNQVTLDGSPLTADRTFEADFTLGSNTYEFFAGFEDVTAQVTAKRNGLYTFAGLTVDNGAPWCSAQAVLGGWSMYVIYEDTGLTGKTLVLYDGFDLERNGSTNYLLTGIYASAPPEAKTTMLLWEGDAGLGTGNEQLLFNASALSDALNPADNVYNGTINSLGVSTSYGLDLDTFDVSTLVNERDTLATTQVDTGPDLVILNSVLLQVKTNIIAGTVFEDVNYGGGPGRNLATAVASAPTFTVPRPGATVELYDAGGNFLLSTVTNATGDYGFAGIPDGDYTVRAVNETLTSSRAGATGSEWPVQTYRTDATAVAILQVTNEVGGADPTAQDDPVNGGGLNLSAITAQSLAPVSIVTSVAKGQVNFGFNFDTVVNVNNGGQGSLRQLITNANTLDGDASLAQFGRPAGVENGIFMISNGTAAAGLQAGNNYFVAGVATIAPTATLPPIDQPIVLNAQLQPGWVAAPIIRLDGASAVPAPVDGLTLANGSDGSTIRGMIFTRFSRDGVVIQAGADGVTIAGSWLGTDGSGVTSMGNTNDGLGVFGAGATIGGIGSDDRNVIVNNLNEGINIAGASASGNFVLGNYIGLEPDGSTGQGNGDVGIAIVAGGGGNTIGGTTPAARNVISMNFEGIEISSANNIVRGNYIGTDAGGTLDRGQTDSDSVQILSGGNNNVIGGTAADTGNLIAFTKSGRHGVSVQAGTGNAVLGNSTHSNTGLGIELGNNGVTVNDGAKSGGQPNLLMDYPVFTTASLSGTTLTLAGYVGSAPSQSTFANARVEVFESDDDPSGFGEGLTFLGFLLADASGNISGTLDVTGKGLVVGEKVTGTASDGSNNTSEFGANFAVTGPTVSVSGTIFEDIAGNVLAGAEAIGDINNPTVSGVDVYLYLDDGGTPGSPDATDTIQNGGAPVVTDGSGVFTFPSIADGTYWAVVDSRTVSPSAGVHPSYLATTPWSEQTFGPDKGWCADGIGGTAERAGVGPCYGGVDGATDDDASALTSSEHVARVVVSGGAVSNVDFGFSYNVVTNVEPAGNVSLTASTYQGSIDQFVRNANAINGANTMRFVPAIPTNAAGGGGAWWRVNYTGSIIGETITNTHDADTSINGTAFDLADGVTVRNTNPGNLGANALGGLIVGVDGVALPQVARPELEVMRSAPAVGVAFDFDSNAGTGQIPNNFAVRNVATWGFVGGVGMTGVAPMRPSGVVVERNVIGSPPDGFVDPTVPGTLRGVAFISTDGATVRDNLIGFVDTNGVSASSTTGTAITGNEIRETGQVDGVADGISYGGTSTTGTITANLIVDSGGMGVDGTATGNLIQNNTVTGSGQRGVQTAGIRQTGSANTVRRNIVTGSIGPGIIVPDTVNAIAVTENRFGSNGSIAIDLIEAGGATATGDGIMLNDGAIDAADGNDGLDYPIIDSAVLSGGNLSVTGYARAGVTLEFYEAIGAANDNNGSGNPHGEGVEYLFTAVEGVADADATTGASYTDSGYGADANVNRFSFTIATPAGLVIGEDISPTAYLAANGTSEFGPNFTVTGPTTNIAGTIFVDEAGDGLADGPIGVAPNLWEGGARIELYRAGPDGDADGGDDTYLSFTTSSAVDGSYSFTGLSADTYYITVDSQGVDDGPYNGAYTATDTWAEQTYGPVGAASFDGVSVWTYSASAGAFYGGAQWDVSDNHVPTNSLPTGEHIARADTTGGDVSNLDFGFSFNVVTTTRGASAAQDPGAGGGQRTVQGSLRQFITNANAQAGSNAMRFVPALPTNATLGGNNWWRVSITAALPNLEDAATVVDGSAYDPADGVTPSNTNTATIGTGAAVGVSGTFTTPLLDPELEIQGDGVVAAAFNALTTADNTEIRNTAINTFATTAINATGILPDPLDSLVVERNVIGTSPASFTDNPSLFTGAGAFARDLSNSTIRNNLVGWVGRGFQISFNTVDTLIETNEIRGADTWAVYLNGVASTGQQAERITLQGNLIESNGFQGLESQHALSDLTINQNTMRLNSAGIRLYGANNTVTGNILSDNSGDGLALAGNGTPSVLATAANLISQNQFGNNGAQAIDLTGTGTNGDGVTINDDGDPDLGANELLNYPIIESAQILGPNLVVSGFALPGTTIEFYIADADPSGFGEGVTYLFTIVEGSGADSDATSGTYGPGPINGLAQGTDTTNRYTFTVPTPVGVSVGTDLTATGTIANATSEFSGKATVSNNADLVMTKVLDASTPGPFAEGDSVTYLLTVTNNGPTQATNIIATDTYPSELTLGAPVPSAPTTYVAGTGVWTIGTLNSGASATLLLPGTINAGTAGDVVTNNVTAATGDQVDPTTVGDDLVETFTVLPFLSIDDVVQVETDSVPGTTTFTFTVSINQAIGTDITFDVDTADNTATVADSDYVAISGGNGTILAGATTTTIDVTVNGDDAIEPDETFFVDLSNVVGAAVTDAQGQGTITNDDGATASVAATTDANEAGPVDAQFTVTQSTTSASDTIVSYTIAGTATAGGTDYTTLSGSVTVLAGATTATIDVTDRKSVV